MQINNEKKHRQNWVLQNFSCPNCRSTIEPEKKENFIFCRTCKVKYVQDSNALNFLTPSTLSEYKISPTEKVSEHQYDKIALTIIKDSGMVLDCGSGKKNLTFQNLIQSEIVDYDNVDVLCVNQKLPFKDNCFDAVLSLAVLEHVDQPFDCAKEILRVLKPGGQLYCNAPFLQREHGYPHHYFGMTQRGLQKLFEPQIEVIEHKVRLSGHPIWGLWMALDTYSRGLPNPLKKHFMELTVEEILNKKPIEWLNEDIILKLSQEARRTIATTTSLLARKKA